MGTQLGAVYELRYRLEPHRLVLEIVGQQSLEVELGDADFFDLGWSPLFNSLPVIRDGLLQSGPPRVYTMRWVDAPALEVIRSEQRYEPLGNGLVRFTAGDFVADIRFDEAGFVVDYPGLAARVQNRRAKPSTADSLCAGCRTRGAAAAALKSAVAFVPSCRS